MDARQCRSKSVLMKFHRRAGSLPPSARPEALTELWLRQLQCPTKRLNNQYPVKDNVVCSAECSAVNPW